MPFQNKNKVFKKADLWLQKGFPFAVYSYPGDSFVYGIFQDDGVINKFEDFRAKGFVFAPFDDKGTKILIPGELLREKLNKDEVFEKSQLNDFSEEGKEQHVELVTKAILQIANKGLEKVVVSRSFNSTTQKQPLEIAHSLLVQYPNAFVYYWHHPKIGTWLGATPERLLKVKNGKLHTTSLAGTLPVSQGKPNWTLKEIEEQAMVTNFITSSLENKLIDLKVTEPKNSKAGKLWHLKSEISGKLKSTNSLSDIIETLHPTPAVCGLPKKEAFNFIQENEGYEREYYTGFLGTVNVEALEEVNLFVNLRCLKYTPYNIKIFVGGGITESSQVEKEWEETQLKSRTMLEVL